MIAQPVAEGTRLDQLCVDTIRTLAMDAVQQANSGHPGTAMAMAPVVYTLWQHFLRFDPDDPIWPNRDRFVLSIGHASMLLYAMLHLAEVKAVNAKYERLGPPSLPRRRGHPMPRLRLDRAAGRRGQRPRVSAARLYNVPEDQGPPHPHHRRQPHRLRLTEQAGHERGARRAARGGGDPPHQE